MVSFEYIKEIQMRFMNLRNIQIDLQAPVMSMALNENEIKEMIYILGQLLYFMTVTERNEI